MKQVIAQRSQQTTTTSATPLWRRVQMSTLKIILASTRPGSIAPAIGAFFADRARSQARFDRVEVLDLAEIALPFLDEPHHPRLGKYTQPHTFAWSRAVHG